ncbi:hypothetical protein AEAC466_18160 [Asticcacaulis sp. AC466]|uniref:hypothetical protein n=1 Tax=Asticcacaulis sp. AC466 TaxID=1282362 RepID=UPI0003C3CA54|nr:hypothetical protein [Asticcacaulis sp. AC466]ESQ82271.1 hypothetical protein AEAC466_18160 [Asticcacaulis sp. AC466]
MKLEFERHETLKAEATHRDFISKPQEARAYEAFLQTKVDKARMSIAAGHGISGAEAEAFMAEKRSQVIG